MYIWSLWSFHQSVSLPLDSVFTFKSRQWSFKQEPWTHKARRVVVFHCLGIAKRFKDGVGLQELAFQLTLWKKTREVRSNKAVRHSERLAPVKESLMSLITIHHIFLRLPKHTQAGEAKSILRKKRGKNVARVMMLKQSFRQSAVHRGSVGVALVDCSTMWFLSGKLDKFNGPRQPNSLRGLVKTAKAI